VVRIVPTFGVSHEVALIFNGFRAFSVSSQDLTV
jgi:hypothetical protein